MAVKYSMRIQLITLIDITQTNARKGDDPFEQQQQQNFLTTVQTLSLRSNPTINDMPTCVVEDVKTHNFGSVYKGKHSIWKLSFEYEQTIEDIMKILNEDFNLVPFITNLTETVAVDIPVFNTNDKTIKNIILVEQKYNN
jgi:hypothetical protein